ncbi:MAG: redoxin domain-containing protein, partial [Dolichospermum sp.]
MPLAVGTNAPAFTTKDTNGNTVSLSDFAGKTVVLYFSPKDDNETVLPLVSLVVNAGAFVPTARGIVHLILFKN